MSNQKVSQFMLEAITLTKKHKIHVSPNPFVGAVIVRNNKIIGKGTTRLYGGNHAEIVAINSVKDKKKLDDATLYSTLEPCVHFGKTAPCVDAIIKSGINRVVIAIIDPDKKVKGKGVKKLRNNLIDVKIGDGASIVRNELKEYIFNRKNSRPYFSVKLATSIDGKIATKNGNSKWLSNEKSRSEVHKFRQNVDAILIGSKTVIQDNPFLTARNNDKLYKRQPVRIVIDSKGAVPLHANIFNHQSKTLVVTTKFSSASWKKKIIEMNHDYIEIEAIDKQINLIKFVEKMHDLGFMHILVEGGGKLVGALLRYQLINKVYFFITPQIIGSDGSVNAVDGLSISSMADTLKLRNTSYKLLKNDILVAGEI